MKEKLSRDFLQKNYKNYQILVLSINKGLYIYNKKPYEKRKFNNIRNPRFSEKSNF